MLAPSRKNFKLNRPLVSTVRLPNSTSPAMLRFTLAPSSCAPPAPLGSSLAVTHVSLSHPRPCPNWSTTPSFTLIAVPTSSSSPSNPTSRTSRPAGTDSTSLQVATLMCFSMQNARVSDVAPVHSSTPEPMSTPIGSARTQSAGVRSRAPAQSCNLRELARSM